MTSINEGYITQDKVSNQIIYSRKNSILYKFLSFFKFRSKRSRNTNKTENSIESSFTHNSTYGGNSRFTSQIVNEKTTEASVMELNSGKPSISIQEVEYQLPLHPLTESIIEYVNEQACATIQFDDNVNVTSNSLKQLLANTPGIIGLKNHGNTCYVNVIVQCLACIDVFTEYFCTKDYLDDLCLIPEDVDDIVATSSIATGINVVIGLAYLLQSLWQFTYNPKISLNFCKLLSLHYPDFSINTQQDAHELLLSILNLLHDNLLRPNPDDSKKESSVIFDRFCGWLYHTIRCPSCGYTHTSTDKMLSLNLQISSTKQEIIVPLEKYLFFIVVTNGNQIAKRHAFEIDKLTTVADIREVIGGRIGCESHNIIILELVESGFGCLFSDKDLIVDISQKNNCVSSTTEEAFQDGLYAVCIPNQVVQTDSIPLYGRSLMEYNISSKTSKDLGENQSFIRILTVHVEKTKHSSMDNFTEINDELRQTFSLPITSGSSTTLNSKSSLTKKHFLRFTNVFAVQAAFQMRMAVLRHSLTEQMCKFLNFRGIMKLPKPQFIIEGCHLIPEFENHPLSHPSVMIALRDNADICGKDSAILRLVVVWPFRTVEVLTFNRRDNIRDKRPVMMNSHKIILHHSVRHLIAKKSEVSPESVVIQLKDVTMEDCLKEFFRLDSGSVTDPWTCPNCESTQLAQTTFRVKEMPEVLIVMLKRFTNDKKNSVAISDRGSVDEEQNDEVVEVDNHIDNHSSMDGTHDLPHKLDHFIEYPVENLNMKPYMEDAKDAENYLYDLVGVVNHTGTLSNGHYVAICQNPVDNQWRIYDDDKVTKITKSDVVHRDAYILFYKRQSSPSAQETGSDLHWSYRRLSFPNKFLRDKLAPSSQLFPEQKIASQFEIDRFNMPIMISNNHVTYHDILSQQNAMSESKGPISYPNFSQNSSCNGGVMCEGSHGEFPRSLVTGCQSN